MSNVQYPTLDIQCPIYNVLYQMSLVWCAIFEPDIQVADAVLLT